MYLIIAEKAIAAKRIALILSDNKAIKKKDPDYGVDLYYFKYKSYPNTVVLGLSGHIVGIDFDSKYNNWQFNNLNNLIDAEIQQTKTNNKIIYLLKKLSSNVSEVIIATDYDREGELIGVEALNLMLQVNNKIISHRALYSAITKKDILLAFSNLTTINFNLASSGYTREVIDLIWGATLTRYISLSAGRLGKMFLSVGRVQSPTLALIVNKEKEINSFVPSKYYEIELTFNKNDPDIDIVCYYEKKRILSIFDANEIYSNIKKEKYCKILNITSKFKEEKVPIPFNTTGFYVAATSIGFSIDNARKIYQKIYELGYLSYPRTDSTIYPENFEFKNLIDMFIGTEFDIEAKKLLSLNILKSSYGVIKDLAHPPLHPVSIASKTDLSEMEWKIYELVVRRFFSNFSSECILEIQNITICINKFNFNLIGSKIYEYGWRFFYSYNIPVDKILPHFEKNELLKIKDLKLNEKKTKPPNRYGQGKLIKKMDKLGIGTKATRVDIINKLVSRYYIYGNPYHPTKIANSVIDTLSIYSQLIIKSEMTKQLEIEMDQIAIGKKNQKTVIESSKSILKKIISDLDKNKESISLSLRGGLFEDIKVGSCHLCKSDLNVMKSKKGLRFIGCKGYPTCNFSLPLPKNGQIIVLDILCELHHIYKINISVKNKKNWELGCPYCNYLNWNKNKT